MTSLAGCRGQNADMEIFSGLFKKLSEKLDVYDRILSKQKYLAGDVSCITVEQLAIPFDILILYLRKLRWQTYTTFHTARCFWASLWTLS